MLDPILDWENGDKKVTTDVIKMYIPFLKNKNVLKFNKSVR